MIWSPPVAANAAWNWPRLMRMRTRAKMIAAKTMIVRLRATPTRCSSGRRAAIARSRRARRPAPAPAQHRRDAIGPARAHRYSGPCPGRSPRSRRPISPSRGAGQVRLGLERTGRFEFRRRSAAASRHARGNRPEPCNGASYSAWTSPTVAKPTMALTAAAAEQIIARAENPPNPSPTTAPSEATAKRPATRATALLIADATPVCPPARTP